MCLITSKLWISVQQRTSWTKLIDWQNGKVICNADTDKGLIFLNTRDTFIWTKKKITTLIEEVNKGYKEAVYSRGKSHDSKHMKQGWNAVDRKAQIKATRRHCLINWLEKLESWKTINVNRDVRIPESSCTPGKKCRLIPSFWGVTRHLYSLT